MCDHRLRSPDDPRRQFYGEEQKVAENTEPGASFAFLITVSVDMGHWCSLTHPFRRPIDKQRASDKYGRICTDQYADHKHEREIADNLSTENK